MAQIPTNIILYRIQNAKNLLLHKKVDIFIIVVFEFLGTLLFTYSTLNLINLKAQAKTKNSPLYLIY